MENCSLEIAAPVCDHPNMDPEYLDLSRLPRDVARHLERYGVATWATLEVTSEATLMGWKGFGPKRMRALREFVAASGRSCPGIRAPEDVAPRFMSGRFSHLPSPTRGVYFIQCETFIKIGMAECVVDRLRGLKGSVPYVLTPLGFIPVADRAHLWRREHALHEAFAAYRAQGEWFADHTALRACIQEHAQPWPAK